MTEQSQIDIYQTEDGQSKVELRLKKDSFWLSQKEMALLFDRDSDTIGLHLKNIYRDKELTMEATTEDSSVVQKEGKRNVKTLFLIGDYF
jgi:hypothetical protein